METLKSELSQYREQVEDAIRELAKYEEENSKLHEAATNAIAKMRALPWGYDGDSGLSNIVDTLEDEIAACAHAAAVAQAQALREAVGWMLRNISGKELRRIGIITSGNLDMDIAAALAASEAGK